MSKLVAVKKGVQPSNAPATTCIPSMADTAAGMDIESQHGATVVGTLPPLCISSTTGAGMDLEEPASAPAGAAGATPKQNVTNANDFRMCLNPDSIASMQPHDINALQLDFAD